MILAVPARATDLSGYYAITQTPYQSAPQSYCLKLVSGGASGLYEDQGSAFMLSTSYSQTRYDYLGQYQLYHNHRHYLSLVLGNYGNHAKNWFLMTAELQRNQWTDELFYDYNIGAAKNKKNIQAYNGTFTATPQQTSCQ
jgi:hypothetical protein